MNISKKAREVLDALRANQEGISTVWDGRRWGQVYLDNARPTDMSVRSFAGYLSALDRSGLYRSMGDDCFGEVLMDD